MDLTRHIRQKYCIYLHIHPYASTVDAHRELKRVISNTDVDIPNNNTKNLKSNFRLCSIGMHFSKCGCQTTVRMNFMWFLLIRLQTTKQTLAE